MKIAPNFYCFAKTAILKRLKLSAITYLRLNAQSQFPILIFHPAAYWKRHFDYWVAILIQTYYVIFVYILKGKMIKIENNRKENHATKVTKNQITKIWDERYTKLWVEIWNSMCCHNMQHHGTISDSGFMGLIIRSSRIAVRTKGQLISKANF